MPREELNARLEFAQVEVDLVTGLDRCRNMVAEYRRILLSQEADDDTEDDQREGNP